MRRADHDSLIGGDLTAVAKKIERHERETGYRVAVADLTGDQNKA